MEQPITKYERILLYVHHVYAGSFHDCSFSWAANGSHEYVHIYLGDEEVFCYSRSDERDVEVRGAMSEQLEVYL